MDPVSTFASAVAVIQLADRIAKICKAYIDDVRDHPKELRVYFIEISAVSIVFQGLQVLEKGDAEDASIISRLGGSDGPVQGCKDALEALNLLLPAPTTDAPTERGSRKRKLRSSLDALAWPLKAKKARKLLDDVIIFKSTINMAIGGSLLQDVQTIKTALSESQVKDVCQWFQHTDPSPNHIAARDLYEDGTGNWVLRSKKWTDWLELKRQCLWIHGIPGAGKTVLAAHLIEKVRTVCEAKNGSFECVYYYCYHGHNQDESVPFLRWLISQLCRQTQNMPPQTYALYKRGEQPRLQDLLQNLQAILAELHGVFVIIDAIDESQNRENLLKVIRSLMTDVRFKTIQLMVTSREYNEIERTMTTISVPLPMSNPLVEEDIKLFVGRRVRAEPRFQMWPQELQDEVQETLSKGAKGMFRWAVCQLDILKRLRYVDKIREALCDLPKGLDDTYERIFSLIAVEDRELVQHALHWLCFHNHLWGVAFREPITTSILLDSYFFSKCQFEPTANKSRPFINTDTLKEACGCLLSYSKSKLYGEHETGVILSHYTVREVLESNRFTGPSALSFKVTPTGLYEDICAVIFRRTLNSVVQDPGIYSLGKPLISIDEYYQLSTYRALHYEANLVQPKLAINVLDRSRPHFKAFQNAIRDSSHGVDSRQHGPIIDPVPFSGLLYDFSWIDYNGNLQISVLLKMLYCGFYSLAHRFCSYDRIFTETKIHVRMNIAPLLADRLIEWEFSGNIFEFFACHPGVGNDALSFLLDRFTDTTDRTRLLHLHICHYSHLGAQFGRALGNKTCLIGRLLQEGAKPRPESCQITPLQIATAMCDITAVARLLEAKADPNDCGDADNTEWDDDEHMSPFLTLAGYSPLGILQSGKSQQFVQMLTDSREYHHSELSETIKNILLAYGANDIRDGEIWIFDEENEDDTDSDQMRNDAIYKNRVEK